ncbi:MAG: KTSC domain-containing protein [Parvibaculaceae bacterium]|nr:KTSC domain-containing protein [Parvibaculaceae bacterium]HBM88829.1 KTSC domain-containing protein [Rhodobiaceae bacterium]
MPYVSSSAISRIEHNAETLVLTIWFTESGGPYDYYGVPKSLYERFLSASSPGTFYNQYIRDQYSGH